MTALSAPTAPVAPTAPPKLHLVDVACRRGERRLFSGLTATVSPGELVWLRGGNGRGKTSLLRVLAGLADPDHGQILWGDTPIRGNTAFAAARVFLAHANALKDDLSALESLEFLARIHGRDPEPAVLRGALRRLGLAGRERMPVRRLSQGLKRRVALARLALDDGPGLWLLDEPFDALDTGGAAALADLLAQHRGRGGSILLASHYLPPAQADGVDRILDLDGFAQEQE